MLTDEVSAQNESLSVIGKCKNLLNPTLQTTTKSGVTCTNNGDGTYTLNGTASNDTYFDLERILKFEDKIYKIVAFKNATSNIFSYVNAQSLDGATDYSILTEYEIPTGYISKNKYKSFDIGIAVLSGTTLTNEIVKPMLTTNLSATYDDYVPYTGDGETLTHDVAELKNDLSPKKIELQNVDERVTIQDNGSFIINGFAFVNLLVTFKETLQQWSNFVRLPRPKGSNVSVYCENSVRLTIYSQDNLPGDCGTYDIVQSGTEVRLLVNYEVA